MPNLPPLPPKSMQKQEFEVIQSAKDISLVMNRPIPHSTNEVAETIPKQDSNTAK